MWINNPPSNFLVLPFPDNDKAYVHNSAIFRYTTIARYSYVNQNTSFIGTMQSPIKIGAFCSIAQNVYCCTLENHQTTYVTTFPLRTILGMNVDYTDCIEKQDGVTIGSDVWIADGVKIMAGVTIGDGCVIGSRAVVTKNCEPYGVYVGMPAKQIKKRFPIEMIEQLLQIQWWNWSLDKIQRNAAFFSFDLNTFSGDLIEKIVD